MSSPFELTSHHGARPQIKTITWEIPRETIQLTLLNSQTLRETETLLFQVTKTQALILS